VIPGRKCSLWKDHCSPSVLFPFSSNFSNYPVEDDEDSDDEGTETSFDDAPADWDKDEVSFFLKRRLCDNGFLLSNCDLRVSLSLPSRNKDGHNLTRGELRALYDYSLVLLVRAWLAPWTPESHMSFQPAFRAAAATIMLSANRKSLPREVGIKVIEFMNRAWWPDDRMQCWNWYCQKAYNFARTDLRHGLLTKNQNFNRCSKCNMATYCTEECRKADWKDRHSRYCNVPPCRIPSFEESMLLSMVENADAAVLKNGEEEHLANTEDAGVDMEHDGDDDDGEWEDMDSDDGNGGSEPLSRTKMIYKFFRENAYSPRGSTGGNLW